MRALAFFAALLLATVPLIAQMPCSTAAKVSALQALHQAQAVALALQQSSMDSGVPAAAVPTLLKLKSALATAADTLMGCESTATPTANLTQHLQSQLLAAAPGLPLPASPAADADDKPTPGVLGNDISVHAIPLSTNPLLLGLQLSSSVPCGSDSQLLIYQAVDDHWQRKVRWSTELAVDKDITFSSDIAGDFFLTAILPMDGNPDSWRAVIAHGTPWCTSRQSSFGVAALGPSSSAIDGHTLWRARRDYSRDDFQPRLKASTYTFELRLNRDAMEFEPDYGFERTVIYRYRISPAGLTRLEPIALNARGFVEEWLSMPSEEARAQQQDPDSEALRQIHHRAQQQPNGKDPYTSWEAGPVRGCSAAGRFQVAFDSQQQHFAEARPGGDPGPLTPHFFQLQQVPDGYQLLSVSAEPDPTCTGRDLMHKPASVAKPR